jgi:hypothetical protein
MYQVAPSLSKSNKRHRRLECDANYARYPRDPTLHRKCYPHITTLHVCVIRPLLHVSFIRIGLKGVARYFGTFKRLSTYVCLPKETFSEPFTDETYVFYVRTQCEPRSKHSPPRLYNTSQCCVRPNSLFLPRVIQNKYTGIIV